MKKVLSTLLSSFLAGILISIGGLVNLSCSSKYLGALAFSVGLFFICECGFSLYTGAIGFALDNKKEDNLMLPVICVGNLLGTLFTSFIVSLTRIYSNLKDYNDTIINTKLNDSWYSILILAVMCGILIYLGVIVFRKSNNNFSKVIGLIFCVFVFIVSGYEHSIADMFYFFFGKSFTGKTFLYILIIVVGNSIGGLLIPCILKLKNIFTK